MKDEFNQERDAKTTPARNKGAIHAREIVPTIDIGPLVKTGTYDHIDLTALDRACRDHGFFLLKGHGLDEVIAQTWLWAKMFFASPIAVKKSIVRTQENPMGWYDRELTKGRRDHKEIFDFTDPLTALGIDRNQWPNMESGMGPNMGPNSNLKTNQRDEFRKAMTNYHQSFSKLSQQTTELVLQALNIPHDTRMNFRGDPSISPVRINHYHTDDPVPNHDRPDLIELGENALGAHTDPGVLTLLLQDGVGGLQTQLQSEAQNGSTKETWLDVVPEDGTIVVNIGDTMQVWTNDIYRAANHRVIAMENTNRMSIPFFLHPYREAVLEPIKQLANGKPHYRSFTWLDYIKARDDDNFDDVGKADTQISDYRIV